MQASFDPFETPFGPEIDAKVDEMIAWADTDDDGLISFDEYKKVIEAGCSPTGEASQRGVQGRRLGADACACGPTAAIRAAGSRYNLLVRVLRRGLMHALT